MCDRCERSVSSFQGCLFAESGQSRRLMMIGIERWESHECNKLGLHSVYEKRITEKETSPKERDSKQPLQCKE